MSASTQEAAMEESQRLQQRYERLLRERAAASLMGEAAAAAAQAEGHEARNGVGTNPSWYPLPYLVAPTQGSPMVINTTPVQVATTMLSQGGNINLVPRPAHQSAAGRGGARASGAGAALVPAPAASSAVGRPPEFQPIDLSRQATYWRPIGPSVQGVITGPFQVHGPHSAATSAGTPAAYAPLGRTSAAYSQSTGSPATYSQAPRPSVLCAQAPGATIPQPQSAVCSATYAPIAGHPPIYNAAQREDNQLQASTFDSFQAASPGSYVYSEHQSTSTLHHVYVPPPMATGPMPPCPPNVAGSREGPTPQAQAAYPPVTSSVGTTEAGAGFTHMTSSSAMPSKTQTPPRAGYARVKPSSAGQRPAQAPPQARSGYPPMTSSDNPNQAQTMPRYFRSISPATPGYWEFIPDPANVSQAVTTQSHQPGASRQRPIKRAAPFSGRRTPFLPPRYLRPVVPSNSPLEAGQSAGQAPIDAPIKITTEARPSTVKSVPSKYEGGKRLRPLQLKRNDEGYEIKKDPGEEISARRDADRRRHDAGMERAANIKPEADANPVADVAQEGDDGPEKDPEVEEEDDGGNEFDVEEYEPEDGDESEDDSGCSDGDHEELYDTWRGIPLPPPAPWAALAFTGEPGEPRPATCANCGRVTIPGLLCEGCCWKPTPGEELLGEGTEYFPAMFYMDEPGSDYGSQGAAGAGRSRAATAGGPVVARATASTARQQPAPTRTADSSVQVGIVSDSECGSCSPDGSEEVFDETDEEEAAAEDGDEEDGEEDGEEVQQESANEAVEKRRDPHDLPQQEAAHSTSTASEAFKEDKEEGKGTEGGEH